MALNKSIVTEHFVGVENAYHRVEAVMHPSKQELKFHLRSYVVKDVIDNDGVKTKIPHDVFFNERIIACRFEIGKTNAWEQAYAHLKTLPEFADAVDC